MRVHNYTPDEQKQEWKIQKFMMDFNMGREEAARNVEF